MITLNIIKNSILFLIISQLLIACNSGSSNAIVNASQRDNTEDTSTKTAPPPDMSLGKQVVMLGDGITPLLINGQASCIQIAESDPISAGTIYGETSYTLNNSFAQMQSYLGGEIDLSGQITDNLIGSIATKLQQTNDSAEDKLSYSFYATAHRPISLSSNYSSMYTDSLQRCGTHYVSAAEAGIFVFANINIVFKSKLAKQTLLASANVKYGDLVDFAGIIDTLDDTSKNSIIVNVQLVQLGGDPQQIFSVLNNSQPNQSELSNLYLADMNVSTASLIIPRIQQYLVDPNDGFNKQVESYIGNHTSPPTKYSQLSHLFVTPSSVEFKPYDNNTISFTPDYEMEKLLKNHRKSIINLANAFSGYDKYYHQIWTLSDTFQNRPARLVQLSDRENSVIKLLSEMQGISSSCYGELIESLTFSSFCDTTLNQQNAKAISLQNQIESSSYDSALRIHTNSTTSESLLFLGSDESSNYYFMTYSFQPVKAVYAPYAIYKLSNNNEMTLYPHDDPLSGTNYSYFKLFGVELDFNADKSDINHIYYDSATYYDQSLNEVLPTQETILNPQFSLMKEQF